MQLQIEATMGHAKVSGEPSTQSTAGMDSKTMPQQGSYATTVDLASVVHGTTMDTGETVSKRLVQRPVAAGTSIEYLLSGITSSASETRSKRLMQFATKASELRYLKTEETPDNA